MTILGTAAPFSLWAQTLQITNEPVGQNVWSGSDITLEVGASDTGPITYQWQFNTNNPVNGIITTVAGNRFVGTYGLAGDGGPATNATLVPWGIAVDTNGDLFISDTHNSRIRKVDRNGIITTYAGNGGGGFYGDGGPAANGSFSLPAGLAVDVSGNLYVADVTNQRIRKVSIQGIITTVAGNGTNGSAGDGGMATNAMLSSPRGVAVDSLGDLFIADTTNNRIRKVDTSGIITTVAGNGSLGSPVNGAVATSTPLNHPNDVAVDVAGNLFIADTGNHTIDEITNGILLIVAGNGTAGAGGDGGAATNAQLTDPYGVAVDNSDDVFIADKSVVNIREVSANGIITTVAGDGVKSFTGDGGPATNASLITPYDVTVDASGSLYISDQFNANVRKVTNLQAQSPTLTLANVAVAQGGNYDVVASDAGGSVTSSVVTLNVGAISNQPLNSANLAGTTATFTVGVVGLTGLNYQWLKNGAAMTNGGNVSGATSPTLALGNVQDADAVAYSVAVTDTMAGSVTSAPAFLLVLDNAALQTPPVSGNLTLTPGVSGGGAFTFQWLFNGAVLTNGIISTVVGGGSGGSGDGGPATNATLNTPLALAMDSHGSLLIGDSGNVRKVDTNGIITTLAAGVGDESLLSDSLGDLFIGGGDRVRKLDTNGIITILAGTGDAESASTANGVPATNAIIQAPFGLVLDGAGNLLIAMLSQGLVRAVDTNDIINTVAGTMGGSALLGDGGPATNAALSPEGLARDAAGNLFIADGSHNRIRKVDTNGIIWTVVNGWNNPLTGAQTVGAFISKLSSPFTMVFDASGNMYISDSGDNLIRKVDTHNLVTTVAGGGGAVLGDGLPATLSRLSSPAGLVVDGSGDLFISDNGNSRIRKVTNTRGLSLTLNNVTPANTGNYQLVVTGPQGSVTSSVVNVAVVSPPVFSTKLLVNADGSVAFNLQTTTNVSSRLFTTTNLTPPITWLPVYTNTSGGIWQFTDTNANGFQSRFYRLSTP